MPTPNNRPPQPQAPRQANVWDVTFKKLVRARPRDLLIPVLGIVGPQRALHLLDRELERLPASKPVDHLIEDRRGTKPLYHLEFEAIPKSDSGRRVFEHFVLIHLRYPTRPLQTIVYYLKPGRERRHPMDHYDCYADGELQSRFRFHTMVLWQIEPATFLDDPRAPALWATVPLCKGATLDHVRQAHRQIIRHMKKEATRHELDTALYVLASTRFDEAALASIFKENALMESWAVKKWMAEGRAEGERMGIVKGERMGIVKGERMGIVKGERMGIVKGERMGRVEGLRLACRQAIAAKLPRVTRSIEQLLDRLDSEAVLTRLVGELAAATDAQAVRAVLQKQQARLRS